MAKRGGGGRGGRGRGPTVQRKPWDELEPGKVVPSAEVAAMIASGELDPDPEVWINRQYAVIVQRRDDGTPYVLRVKRVVNGEPRWEHLQRIKDELAGPDAEAVELFPAEARRLDLGERWLWCVRPGERWPFGRPETKTDQTSEAEPEGEEAPPDAPVIDLMAALRESVDAAKAKAAEERQEEEPDGHE